MSPSILNTHADFSSLLAPIAHQMDALDGLIREQLKSDVVLVNQVAEYIIAAGGKRLRPALLLLLCGALAYQEQDQLTLAGAIEFIHTATLLHDDVVDESLLRRNQATANALFGNSASVLVGDFLYSRAFQLMVCVDNMAIMRTLADATNIIAEGEVLQLLNIHDPDVSQQRYFQVIRYKTAKLFEAAARGAALLADADQHLEERCAEFGRRIGTAFQLIDDVLDYSGVTNELGKSVGDDLREGKPTLPLIYLLEHGTREQQNLVRQAIIGEHAEQHFATIQQAILQSGALDYARRLAQGEVDAARITLATLPDSSYKTALLKLCDFAIEREF